jgi:hypothetical protein
MNSEVINWLESPAGESWSRERNGNPDGTTFFLVSVKDENDITSSILWYR